MRLFIALLVGVCLFCGCVSKKVHKELIVSYDNNMSHLKDSLQFVHQQSDSLYILLTKATGGNEQLLLAQAKLLDRLLDLDDENEGLRGNLSNTQSSLNSQLASLRAEQSALIREVAATHENYQTVVTDFQSRLDSVAIRLAKDSAFATLAEVRTRSGSLSIIVQEAYLFRGKSMSRLATETPVILSPIARLLQAEPLLDLTIIGHTDNQTPSRSGPDNWSFSAQRAATLAGELTTNYDVSPNRLTAAGQGAFSPRQSNATDAGRKANRRIEFLVTNSISAFLRELSKQDKREER